MTTVQNIAKKLVAAGLKKATAKRVNFQTIFIGDYEARHLKVFGLNCITVTPKNGMTCERIRTTRAQGPLRFHCSGPPLLRVTASIIT